MRTLLVAAIIVVGAALVIPLLARYDNDRFALDGALTDLNLDGFNDPDAFGDPADDGLDFDIEPPPADGDIAADEDVDVPTTGIDPDRFAVDGTATNGADTGTEADAAAGEENTVTGDTTVTGTGDADADDEVAADEDEDPAAGTGAQVPGELPRTGGGGGRNME